MRYNLTQTQELIVSSLLIAFTVVISLILLIPVPNVNGFISLTDLGIYLASLLLGSRGGFLVGAMSGGLIDLFSGFGQFIVFSIIIHGLQGLISGYLLEQKKLPKIISLLLGSIVMVIGYFFASWFLFNLQIGAASIFSNLVQTLIGAILSLIIYNAIERQIKKRP